MIRGGEAGGREDLSVSGAEERENEWTEGEDEDMTVYSTVLGLAALDTNEDLRLTNKARCKCTCMYVSLCAFLPVLTLYDQASTNSCLSVKLPDNFFVILSFFLYSYVPCCLSLSSSVFSTLTCPLVLFYSPFCPHLLSPSFFLSSLG